MPRKHRYLLTSPASGRRRKILRLAERSGAKRWILVDEGKWLARALTRLASRADLPREGRERSAGKNLFPCTYPHAPRNNPALALANRAHPSGITIPSPHPALEPRP